MSSEWQFNEQHKRQFKDVYTNGKLSPRLQSVFKTLNLTGEHWRRWDREDGPFQKIGPDRRYGIDFSL